MSMRVFSRITHARLVTAIVVAGLVTAVGGVAWAAIPDSTGVVHACYKTSDATKPGGAGLSVIDTDRRSACRAGETALTLAQPAPPAPSVVTGSVDASGTVTDGNGNLSATMLAAGLYAVTYDGFDPSHPGIVTLSATSSYSAAASTITRIPSDDAGLQSALGGPPPPGIIVRSLRHDGSAAPFEIHIDRTQAPAPAAGLVAGSVSADGTITDGQGGLAVTVLMPGLYLLTYPGFDLAHPGVVTGSAVSSFSAARPSTFDRIPSDDPGLLAAVGGSSPLPGIVVRSVRADGSAASFDVHIDTTSPA
jgi:hypothetical protein